MKINEGKTKIMVIDKERQTVNLQVTKTRIELVNWFQCLIVIMDNKGSWEKQITTELIER